MARLIDVRVPDMGNFKDVAVIDVLVKAGESIEREAPLVTVETEKATMDVPSDAAGVIEKVHVAKGGKVSAGDVIVTLRADGANGADAADAGKSAAPGAAAAPSAAATSTSRAAPPATADTSSSRPAAATGDTSTSRAAPASGDASASRATPATGDTSTSRAPPKAQDPAAEAKSSAHSAAPATEAERSTLPGGRTDLPPINEPGFSRAHAGPSVRRFARELGVDLTQVTGTGFKARITEDDVKGFVKKLLTGGGTRAPGAGAPVGIGLPKVPVVDFAAFGPVETKPLTRIQKISGPRLHASWVNLPHVTQFDEADITDLEDVRNKLKQKAQTKGIKLTPLAFVVRAVARVLQEFPTFNSSLDESGQNLVLKKYTHIGFAADTPNGLVVPVIRDADRKDVYELARLLAELSEKARGGKLQLADMQGGTFTISSLGGIGGTAFTPIINAPEVAILGVSKSSMKPVFKEGGFVPRLILPLSLSYDHRVVDGATAVRFTTALAGVLSDPRQLTEAVP
jgi:pyruvate dehydrogenase E2 component (dihydrolipoamide acetyltransferase)